MILPLNTILSGDALQKLKSLPDKSINCCITSPPYYGLRDYGVLEQIGLEPTPEEYIQNLISVFKEVYRVLQDDGTLWINIGDSYNGSRRGSTKNTDAKWCEKTKNTNSLKGGYYGYTQINNLKEKDLIGIPWMLAFALRADGWYLRQDIIWHKPNVMPESVKDRCTKAHEYLFLLSKSRKYYFDNEAIKESCVTNDKNIRNRDISKLNNTPGRTRMNGLVHNNYEKRNKRDVWSVSPASFKGAHFAVFPEKLITDCIKAGCPESGIVLDPFFGSGTTGVVAIKLNRNYIGIELNEEYTLLAKERLSNLK